MALSDDFTVYPYSKVIRHTNASSDATYTVQAFYSWLMDLFDEPAYLSYENPIKYNTPTQYTMQNGWFIDNGDGSEALKYLKGGSILTSGYADDVLVIDLDDNAVAYTAFDSTDKDKTVNDDAGDIGPLLGYKNNYPDTDRGRCWVRDTNTNGTVADDSAITVDSGTGSAYAAGASYTGDEIYTNLYSIASFPSDVEPQVYVFQQDPDGTDTRLEEWSFTDQFDRGTIDIIIPVQVGGSAINSGLVDVFARQSGDTFTHVASVDLSAGSRTPVALETSPDEVNLLEAQENHVDYYMFFNNQGNTISVDDVITNIDPATVGTQVSWYAEVASIDDWGTEGVLGLRGLKGTPASGNSIFVGATDCADVNGTVGDYWIPYNGETQAPAAGDLGDVFVGGSSGAQGVLRAYQDDGTTGKLLFQVYHTHGTFDTVDFTGTGRDPLYRDFESAEAITASGAGAMSVTSGTIVSGTHYRATSGFSDITVAHVNGTIVVNNFGGSGFIQGEKVTWDAGARSAVMLYTNGSTSMTLGNVSDETTLNVSATTLTGALSDTTCDTNGTGGLTDANTQNYEFPLQSFGDTYNVFVECGEIYQVSRTLDQVYAYLQFRCRDGEEDLFYTSTGSAISEVQGQAYIKAVAAHATSKTAPFGTLAGGVFFGAQGVWVENPTSADTNNVKVTSHEGNAREAFLSVDVTVSNTRVSDVITVFLEDGSTGLPDKEQFTCAVNTKSDSTLQGSATHPNDTPSSGWVYVVDTSANEEHKYRYTEWTTDTLTLATEVSGVAEGGTTGQTLEDTGVFASGVERGDIIRRTGDDAWCYVISVDDNDTVTTTVLSDGTDWAESDAFEVNSLVADYTGSDYYFIPYLETIEDTGTDVSPGSETNTLTYVSDRAVVIRVRNVLNATKIQPFVTTSDITAGGMNVSAIRNTDEVFS